MVLQHVALQADGEEPDDMARSVTAFVWPVMHHNLVWWVCTSPCTPTSTRPQAQRDCIYRYYRHPKSLWWCRPGLKAPELKLDEH